MSSSFSFDVSGLEKDLTLISVSLLLIKLLDDVSSGGETLLDFVLASFFSSIFLSLPGQAHIFTSKESRPKISPLEKKIMWKILLF